MKRLDHAGKAISRTCNDHKHAQHRGPMGPVAAATVSIPRAHAAATEVEGRGGGGGGGLEILSSEATIE
jgi:hypothetical protein